MFELLKKIDGYQQRIEKFRPFEENLLPLVRNYYRIGLVYSSNALEGFTYTETETKILLEDGLTAGGRPLRDTFAVLGHAKAYDYMYTLLHSNALTEKDILTFHTLLEGSLDNNALPGTYRNVPAFVSGSDRPFLRHQDIQSEMDKLFDFMKEKRNIFHPVEFGAILHKKLIAIHPFADGNGRVTRLAMNTSLIQKGFLPVIIPPILRHEYIAGLRQVDRNNDKPFFEFIFRCEIETQKEMLRLLEGAQADAHLMHAQTIVISDEPAPEESTEFSPS